jgi:hypothetical protein
LAVDSSDLRGQLAQAVEPYEDLLIPFARGEMEADEFEASFQQRYLNDSTLYSDAVFDVFDRFFSDVDEYVADPKVRKETGGLGPVRLRECAVSLLQRAGRL